MKKDTRLVTAGRHPERQAGAVNPPVYHASTILFPTLEALDGYHTKPVTYGRHGTPGTHAFEEAMCEIEGAALCRLTPSGLAAISTAVLAFAEAGDDILVADCVYEPTRAFCDHMLTRLGMRVRYYDPCIGAGIAALLEPATRLILTESPGTRSFEVQDIPAIVAAARAHSDRVLVLMDNTWATPHLLRPLDLGVDISIQSATKYIVGHADALLGTICVGAAQAERLKRGYRLLGQSVGPDDVYLAMRGLRTLGVRLRRHEETGLALARWLKARPDITRVLHPALPDDPGHALWRRDFSGASGLFGFEMIGGTRAQVAAMLDGYRHFGMGFSWGGFESLITPSRLEKARTATRWDPRGPVFRISAGLEDAEDLIADLEAGFARFHAAA
ncbi:MAG: cystathionine beta-lyase [Alphaproteobacteria bacterium]|nr:cystathionine beta-lyase [Alphaproteobacteria bacterium]